MIEGLKGDVKRLEGDLSRMGAELRVLEEAKVTAKESAREASHEVISTSNLYTPGLACLAIGGWSCSH